MTQFYTHKSYIEYGCKVCNEKRTSCAKDESLEKWIKTHYSETHHETYRKAVDGEAITTWKD